MSLGGEGRWGWVGTWESRQAKAWQENGGADQDSSQKKADSCCATGTLSIVCFSSSSGSPIMSGPWGTERKEQDSVFCPSQSLGK